MLSSALVPQVVAQPEYPTLSPHLASVVSLSLIDKPQPKMADWTPNYQKMVADKAQAAEEAKKAQEAAEAAQVAEAARRATIVSSTPVASYNASTNGYDFGYCTWYVASRRSVPGNWGNANQWYAGAQAAGWATGIIPRPGAIGVSFVGAAGHVVYVESVSGTSVTVSEMNALAGWDHVDTATYPMTNFVYIY